jgi:sulfide:quinone oxidoreductase
VILGGGTGGTLAANRLRRHYRTDQRAITVVDQGDRHVYQPGLLFVPRGCTWQSGSGASRACWR